ncbi:hypothetical protein IVB33_11190 [Bradyrhizobium sp. 24]|uniref:hypothetical protein n=1 Tax=unclassified Bradyrhizobium TaxID=2631580 RepID=UPI001FF9BB04|nr:MULTISPECIES: hypothetical protein [unclassified Bradyrhizobium]MCK1301981.1 hypothetical protein [Bradyrhizobium sp. 37]MCK1378586.1 hypothetical protein [Bradyrhizobium sp. 24]MCK1773438.1 hypothetical protein [Bradyrhizobium sp. 134]
MGVVAEWRLNAACGLSERLGAGRLVWSERKGWGSRIGVSWRYDNGLMQMTTGALFSQDGTTLYLWSGAAGEAVASLRKAKRLRVTLGQAFYDFDLTKGDALPAIRCG